ncbi:hypothetical protein C8J57DRAFT_1257179 [Mycena rebaudengoi]|nr:hypothetical protein C8J57DRAFT_1257179 [Mycena rebaudengoi]
MVLKPGSVFAGPCRQRSTASSLRFATIPSHSERPQTPQEVYISSQSLKSAVLPPQRLHVEVSGHWTASEEIRRGQNFVQYRHSKTLDGMRFSLRARHIFNLAPAGGNEKISGSTKSKIAVSVRFKLVEKSRGKWGRARAFLDQEKAAHTRAALSRLSWCCQKEVWSLPARSRGREPNNDQIASRSGACLSPPSPTLRTTVLSGMRNMKRTQFEYWNFDQNVLKLECRKKALLGCNGMSMHTGSLWIMMAHKLFFEWLMTLQVITGSPGTPNNTK